MTSLIQWGLLVLPWFSLFFIGSRNLLRYVPVALFVTVINTIMYQAAYHYNWWREAGVFEWDDLIPVSWVYSAYLVATIWIFRLTYGRFWLYLLVNLVLDGLYIYVWYPVQQRLGLAASDISLSPTATYAMMTGIALLIYLYQMWQDGLYKLEGRKESEEEQRWKWKPGIREKAK